MKSFLKSLPSHRKKEKARRTRKRESDGGGGDCKIKIECAKFLDQTGELNLDYRRGDTGGAANFSEAKQSQCSETGVLSPLTDEGSFVAGTQIRNSRSVMPDENDADVGISAMQEQQHSPADDIEQEQTENRSPPTSQCLNDNTEETFDFGIDFKQREAEKKTDHLEGSDKNSGIPNIDANLIMPKQLQSDGNDVPNVDSAKAGNRCVLATTGETRHEQQHDVMATKQPNDTIEPQQEDEISLDETHMSLELIKRSDAHVPDKHIESNNQEVHPAPSSQMEKEVKHKHHSQDSSKPTSTEKELTPSSHRSIGNADFVLSTTDIRQCIKEVEEAKELSQKDSTIFNVDIGKFQDCLQQFEKYVCALSDESSEEAKELQIMRNEEDRAFVIFDRGMNIDHCNVMFIRDVICTISGGLDDQKRNSQSQVSRSSCDGGPQRKLDQFATGLDFVFGIGGDVESKVGVTITNYRAANGTKLLFTKTPHSVDATKPRDQQSSTIPSHLNEISEIFTRFAADETRTLQSQLDATHLALSKLRSHAMALQAQALKATDQALHAEDETKYVREQFEVELYNLQSKYELQKKSFDKAKKDYEDDLRRKQLEIDQLKYRYENELKAARSEMLLRKTTKCNAKQEDVSNGKNITTNRDSTQDNTNQSESRSYSRNVDHSPDAKRRKIKEGASNRAALKPYSVNNFSDKPSSNTNLARPGKAPPKKASSSVMNPYKKNQTKAKAEEDVKPTFAYQEVVRKRDERMALPAHDCEECKKFLDALEAAGGHINRDEIINNCSRHRSRHKPASTPPHYWTMSFMDSQYS